MTYLYVFWDVFSFRSWDVCLCVWSRLQPEGNQPTDKDDSGLKETLFGAELSFTGILLSAHHAVVRFRTHRRDICGEKDGHFSFFMLDIQTNYRHTALADFYSIVVQLT